MSFRKSFHVKASMDLTRADHFYIELYEIPLNIMLRPIILVHAIIEPTLFTCISDALDNLVTKTMYNIYIYIYIYIYICLCVCVFMGG